MAPDVAADERKARRRAQRQYKYSAVGRGFIGMIQNFGIVIVFVTANAAIQALLVWAVRVERAPLGVWLPSTIASAIVVLVCLCYIARVGLADKDERLGFAHGVKSATRRMLPFAGWTVVYGAIVTAGVILGFWPGLVAAAIFVYAPLLALDGEYKNPLGKSVIVVGQRFWHYIGAVVVFAILAVLVAIGSGLDMVFLPAPLAPFVSQFLWGLYAAWAICTFGVLYRSTDTAEARRKERRDDLLAKEDIEF